MIYPRLNYSQCTALVSYSSICIFSVKQVADFVRYRFLSLIYFYCSQKHILVSNAAFTSILRINEADLIQLTLYMT